MGLANLLFANVEKYWSGSGTVCMAAGRANINEAMAFFDTVSHDQQVNTVFSPGGPLFAGFEGKHYLCSPSFSLL